MAGISVRLPPPMAASMEVRIIEYDAAPTLPLPPSLLTLLSSPLPKIPSLPLPLPSPPTHTSPTYAEAPLGYRAAGIRSRAASPLPLPAPSSLLPLPATDRKEDVLEADSSAAAAARQPESFMARRADYGFVDTMDANIRAAEEGVMAADDRAVVRAEIKVLRRERLAYERESSETRQALARSEAHNRALEARIATMETQLYRLEWQC
ncbi:hypothetical protein Tco_0241583 [Tanacetum coccineum]